MGVAMKTYHSVDRLFLDKSIIKHFSQISTLRLAQSTKVIHERRIEQREFLAHSLQIGTHVVQAIFPELADEEPSLAMRLIHLGNKLSEEILAEVLHGIEANAL